MFAAIFDDGTGFSLLLGREMRTYRSFDAAWRRYLERSAVRSVPVYFVGAEGEIDLLDGACRAIRRVA
jgi:hypothetical protein